MCNAWCFLHQCKKESMGHQKYTTDGANWPGSRRDGDPFLAKRTAGVPGCVQSGEDFFEVAGADSVLDSLLTRRRECSSSRVFKREKRWPLPEASYDNNGWLSTDLQAAENLAGSSTLILWWSYDSLNLAAPTLWCHLKGRNKNLRSHGHWTMTNSNKMQPWTVTSDITAVKATLLLCSAALGDCWELTMTDWRRSIRRHYKRRWWCLLIIQLTKFNLLVKLT